MPANEIGRELKASELKPRTVAVIAPPGKDMMVTMWVRTVDTEIVTFYAGELSWTVVNFVQPDGSIHDDLGRVVRVYEYLGEV